MSFHDSSRSHASIVSTLRNSVLQAVRMLRPFKVKRNEFGRINDAKESRLEILREDDVVVQPPSVLLWEQNVAGTRPTHSLKFRYGSSIIGGQPPIDAFPFQEREGLSASN
jgi:hypothetical protein